MLVDCSGKKNFFIKKTGKKLQPPFPGVVCNGAYHPQAHSQSSVLFRIIFRFHHIYVIFSQRDPANVINNGQASILLDRQEHLSHKRRTHQHAHPHPRQNQAAIDHLTGIPTVRTALSRQTPRDRPGTLRPPPHDSTSGSSLPINVLVSVHPCGENHRNISTSRVWSLTTKKTTIKLNLLLMTPLFPGSS